jgi:ABC-type transport system substrate-binding protein
LTRGGTQLIIPRGNRGAPMKQALQDVPRDGVAKHGRHLARLIGPWRDAVLMVLTALLALLASGMATAQDKVLRHAFPVAESGFDPSQISDLYSAAIANAIFEAPLEFEYLAQPARLRPNTAAAMPEVSDNFRRFTFRIRPGIYFADDPAFGGKKRELTAADYVYSIKRHFDPRWKSQVYMSFAEAKVLGLMALRERALATKKPFDYESEVEGLRTLDRYTFEVRLAEPEPAFLYNFAFASNNGAMAREVVERYGDKIAEHPAGTGPFRLAQWTRSSRIVLQRNPGYREHVYDENPAADDAPLQAIAARFKGRRLPMIDRIEVSIIEEVQPRWLSFLNGALDLIEAVPTEFVNVAAPGGKLAPNLAKRGIGMQRYARPDIAVTYFAMEHPVVGGYTPDKVALRRAISLAVDVEREIRIVRRGQAVPAQSIVGPFSSGFVPGFKSEMSEYNPAKAKALLDMHGYVDKDGDGWRDMPDGTPLVLERATQPDQLSRQTAELWRRDMNAIGLRIEFKPAKWPENMKASRAGKLMMWGLGFNSGDPDGGANFLGRGYGPSKGGANHARFDLPAFNALYERQRVLPDGPEREALMHDAKRLLVAYRPYKAHVHRISTDLWHPWVQGYNRIPFAGLFWKYIDIDTAHRAPAAR